MRRSISGARFATLVMAGGLLLLAACGGGGSGTVGLGGPVTPDPVGPDPVPNEPDPIDPNCPKGSYEGTFEAISEIGGWPDGMGSPITVTREGSTPAASFRQRRLRIALPG